jgi:uncharacterized LabA/DUF88 family protein
MRTYAYVDGFNLYYGALKGTNYRWLNIADLIRQVMPAGHKLLKIRYFTARVSGAVDPGEPRRQDAYLRAISTLPEVDIHYGTFLSKTIWRPLINLPIANRRIGTVPPVSISKGDWTIEGSRPQTLPVGDYPTGAGPRYGGHNVRPLADAVVSQVHTMEEKGSDVNLASYLLNDAWRDFFDVGVVLSNDTDLVEPIRMVTRERGKAVTVLCPGRWGVAAPLTRVASHVRHIRHAHLKASQFADPVVGTAISKPQKW